MICRYCGAPVEVDDLLHALRCDGQQGRVEAAGVTIGPHFDGETYDPGRDHDRLTGQMRRVSALMVDGVWRTLDEISAATGAPAQSVSARLRDLRKEKFGALTVERRIRAEAISSGLWEYRVLVLAVAR